MSQSPPRYVNFDGMTWPAVGSCLHTLEYRLRYCRADLTDSDLLYAASVVAAYDQLVRNNTQVQRNYICGILKQNVTPYGGDPE